MYLKKKVLSEIKLKNREFGITNINQHNYLKKRQI